MGDELQTIHRLLFRTVLPMPITNFESGLELSVRAILESPTIEELAERIERALAETYAEFIRARQPSGPCRLLGWCNGGLYAWATAGVLEKSEGLI